LISNSFWEIQKKKLKNFWKDEKKKKELENAYKNVCEQLIQEQKKSMEASEKVMYSNIRNSYLLERVDKLNEELNTYKKMYIDELQKRLELGKLVEEKEGNSK
jgi:hypothetical protein